MNHTKSRHGAASAGQINVQAAFSDVIARVESVIDQETALLRENRAVQLSEFNTRKQQSLLELNRLLRNVSQGDLKRMDRDGVMRPVAQARDQQAGARAPPARDGRDFGPGVARVAGRRVRRHIRALRRLNVGGVAPMIKMLALAFWAAAIAVLAGNAASHWQAAKASPQKAEAAEQSTNTRRAR